MGLDLKPSEKYCLSLPEAAEYSMIGQDRLKNIMDNDPSLDWILKVGTWTRIKRVPFEQWILTTDSL